MVQGVLFDMDGVLFDTEKLCYDISRRLLQEMGHAVPTDLLEKTCGVNQAEYRRVMMALFGPDFAFDQFNDAAHEGMFAHYEAHGIPEKPGVRELLQYLRAQGIPAALASSTRTPTIKMMLDKANLRGYFAGIIGGDMVTNSKPDPEIFIKAAALLGVPPTGCAAVEDSVNGVRSASAAGCKTIMVPDLVPPTEELRGLAAAIAPSLLEVPALLETL